MRKLVVIFFFLFLSLHAEDSTYELGKGKQVGSLPLFIGGYFSLDYRNMGSENRYRADDIAILGYGSYDKFSYMAELEYKSFYVQTYQGNISSIKRNTQIHTERVYIDYTYNENYMFRIGKYNSPVGFWNLLPVNVLRETTSSPISSSILYPKFTTGLGLSYSSFNDSELKVNLMFQNNEDLDDEYNNYKINEHYAFGILYEKDDYALRLNAGAFNRIESQILQDKLYYFLVSAKYDTENYQIISELGYQQSETKVTTPYAGYIQGLYRFTQQHIGVLRVESYEDNLQNKNDDIAIFGYTYRPSYPVAIKSEYQVHSLTQENQFLFSISVLF